MKPRITDLIYMYLQGKGRAVQSKEMAKEFKCRCDVITTAINRLNKIPGVRISKKRLKSHVYYKLETKLPLNQIRPKPFINQVYDAMQGAGRVTLKQIAVRMGDSSIKGSRILQSFNGLNNRPGVTVHRFCKGNYSEYLLEVDNPGKTLTAEEKAMVRTPFNPVAINFIFSNRSSEIFKGARV